MNKRIFYAIQQVGFAKDGFTSVTAAHGVTQVGVTTTFDLQQVFELGQLAIYQLVEQIPDVEITMEKNLDGYPLLYHLATNGSTQPGLVGRSTSKTEVVVSVFPDNLQSASGTPIAELHCSGAVLNTLGYTFSTTDSCKENVTLIGQSKIWRDIELGDTSNFAGAFPANDDQPLAITGSGGVQFRWNVLFYPLSGSPTGVDENGMTNAYMTVLPTDIYGVTSSGTNPTNADGTYKVSVQSINISTDLGRTPIYQLGRKSFFFRYVNFPIEVRTDIEVISTKFDGISGDEFGGHNGAPSGSNLKNQTIRVQTLDGTRVDTGTRNKLSSVTYTGGDAASGGSNVSNRYSYVTYNTMNVYHPQDPSALAG